MDKTPGQALAVSAEVLYLVNLMLLPGVAFLALLILFLLQRRHSPPLALNHLTQTTGVSIIGGGLIVIILAVIVATGGLDAAYTWVVAVLYFTFIHSTLILCGVIGLVRALAGQTWRYPLIGRHLPA
ncbi:MAG: hypothetical protein KDG50_01900 [Chromatiales bacterium]|nr:hypothetical protein [Chromatiales bacterium]